LKNWSCTKRSFKKEEKDLLVIRQLL